VQEISFSQDAIYETINAALIDSEQAIRDVFKLPRNTPIALCQNRCFKKQVSSPPARIR
jgi:hypothetical protein